MDMMELRRRLMRLMASGVEVIKGTFTVTENSFELTFGKSFNRYVVFIEMTDASIGDLIDAAQTSNKMYTYCGVYGVKSVNGYTPASNAALPYRYNGSSVSAAANSNLELYPDKLTTYAVLITTNSANNLYIGYTYNYYILPID